MDEIEQELETTQSANYTPVSALSSVQSSPRSATKMVDDPFETKAENTKLSTMADQENIVLGQFSYAPAVQTTVVTTTTTTTTTFPPILMKAPKHLQNLDRSVYPLAASPTPTSIKRFQFNIGDQSAIFQEADDTGATLASLKRQEENLKASGGRIQNTSTTTETPYVPRSFLTPSSSKLGVGSSSMRNHKSTVSRRVTTSNPDPRQKSSRLQAAQTSGTQASDDTDIRPRAVQQAGSRRQQQTSIVTPDLEDAEFPPIPSPEEPDVPGPQSNALPIFANATPSRREVLSRRLSSNRSRPSALDTASVNDGALPSPSLSPVTAAANLKDKQEYFAETPELTLSSNEQSNLSNSMLVQPFKKPNKSGKLLGIHDIPVMIDAFDAMPQEMKNYYMFQLLKRCPKAVLHFVAETVEPALKRDFLGELPPELSQQIIKSLDVKSLCRASQVCKQWRKIVDTDEKIWKAKFDAEGFSIMESELKRAIQEGWGWQADSRREGKEIDVVFAASADNYQGLASNDNDDSTTTSTRRGKRKATNQSGRSRKQRKRRNTVISDTPEFDSDSFERHLSAIDGPYAAAELALAAVPKADVGLPSLSVLHLQKSLYRRHYQFSQSWIKEIEPRHLAFRAHSLNVITCLQFDGERIVTGSDDTNINVYNTQTGALKAKLAGHDGGVWALQYVGNQLVSGSTDRSVRIWDMDAGICTHTFFGHTSTVRCLVILLPTKIGMTAAGKPIMLPEVPLIITGSRDSTLRVWRLPKPEDPHYNQAPPDDQDCPYLVRTLSGHGNSVRAIAAQGDTLVSGSYDYTVRVWEISTGRTIHRLAGHAQKVYSVVGDWEGKRVISGSMDNMVKIWSLETGSLLFNLEGHTSLVGLLDYQKGRLVSAAADGSLRIWSCDSGVCVKNLTGHGAAITCFQHDATKIISGSDRSLKLWDINNENGAFVRDLLHDLSGVWQVKFDERRCVAAVQRQGQTYIEVLDFGASRDGLPSTKRGRRILVDENGVELHEPRAEAEDDEEPDDGI